MAAAEFVTRALIVALIHLYRVLVSPLLGPHCRFYPTCSAYALQAVRTHGAAKGSWLSFSRIMKCHPWHAGGCDPVPSVMTDASRER